MPALSFKLRFVPKVESGEKRHTIRAMRKRPFKPGDDLALFYAMRTKQCRRLFSAPCVKVERISIYPLVGCVEIDGNSLVADEMESLAVRDGFASWNDMLAYWRETHGLDTFEGQVIHWDYNRRRLAE